MTPHDWIPPLLLTQLRRWTRATRVFDTHGAALAASGGGYENDRLVDVVYRKTRLYRDQMESGETLDADFPLTRILAGMALAQRGAELRVLDFGGACGTHYWLARRVLGDRTKLHWHVVETPAMVKRAKDFEEEGLRFFDDLDQAAAELPGIDLLFSSSAIQYLPDPLATLARLTALRARQVFLTKIGLATDGRNHVSLQQTRLSGNGPGPMPPGLEDAAALYPVTFVDIQRFESLLQEHYRIDIRFLEERGTYLAGRRLIDMYGYFASKKMN